MREYDQIAEWYASTRSPTIGVADVASLAETLPVGMRVLDLGCGNGIPISQLLVREGFEVVGLDSSTEMVRRFRANLPDVTVHLSETDQAVVLEKTAEWLKPAGRLLFTSGDVASAREGKMDGVAFQYVSLDREGYARTLEGAGMHPVRDYVGGGGDHAYLAEKTAEAATKGRPRGRPIAANTFVAQRASA